MSEAGMAPARAPRSYAGPIVLILLGVIFLLGNMNVIGWRQLGWYFAKYWPLLIILWGAIKLVEYYQARNRGAEAPRLGAGSVILVIFLVLAGLSASTASRIDLGKLNDNVQVDNGD